MSTTVHGQKHGRSDGRASDAEDPETRNFYGPAVSEAYRLKPELVAQHLAKFDMGMFQYLLFIVTGFGWIVDNF
ncbi:hypothetical protein PISL3812_00080 [Talaromyces islandicus]|uniref:Uncharacterized protein n=1 Tax=Talaromyces islandicus TaxID=28573 RepID=A0A0U1LIB0_TALIS|nr:hypothetical protein PISL3812_00080 [Talaromyces islandicus]